MGDGIKGATGLHRPVQTHAGHLTELQRAKNLLVDTLGVDSLQDLFDKKDKHDLRIAVKEVPSVTGDGKVASYAWQIDIPHSLVETAQTKPGKQISYRAEGGVEQVSFFGNSSTSKDFWLSQNSSNLCSDLASWSVHQGLNRAQVSPPLFALEEPCVTISFEVPTEPGVDQASRDQTPRAGIDQSRLAKLSREFLLSTSGQTGISKDGFERSGAASIQGEDARCSGPDLKFERGQLKYLLEDKTLEPKMREDLEKRLEEVDELIETSERSVLSFYRKNSE